MDSTNQRYNPLWFLLLLLLIGTTFFLFIVDARTKELLDLSIFYRAGERLNQGLDIYEFVYREQVDDGRTFPLRYYYPPFLAMGLGLVQQFLSFQSVKTLWCVLDFLSLMLSSVGLLYLFRELRPQLKPTLKLYTGILFFLVCFEPVYWGVRDGQVHLFVLALLIWHLLFATRRQYVTSGICLALAALIKMSPLLLLLGYVRPFRPRVFLGFGWVCLVAIGILFFGAYDASIVLTFFQPFTPLLSGELERYFAFNFAVDKALLSVFQIDHVVPLRWVIKLLLLAAPIVVAVLDLGESAKSLARKVAILTCCMVLAAPIIWIHHLTWILLPLAVALFLYEAQGTRRLRYWVFLAGVYFMLSQTALFHYQVLRNIPQLLPFTGLFPTVGIIWLVFLLGKPRSSSDGIESA